MIKTLSLLAQGGFALGPFDADQQQIIASIIDDILSISLTFAIVNLAIFFPAVFRGIHKKINSSRVNAEWSILCHVSLRAVMAAEIAISGHNPQLKYDFASHFIDSFCKQNNLFSVDDNTKRILIESSLYELRRQFSE